MNQRKKDGVRLTLAPIPPRPAAIPRLASMRWRPSQDFGVSVLVRWSTTVLDWSLLAMSYQALIMSLFSRCRA